MDPVNASFGSDKYGLVWGYAFAPGVAARPIDCERAANLLSGGSDGSPSDDTFVWLHFSLANAAAERWLRQNLSVPDSFHAALHEEIGSTGGPVPTSEPAAAMGASSRAARTCGRQPRNSPQRWLIPLRWSNESSCYRRSSAP